MYIYLYIYISLTLSLKCNKMKSIGNLKRSIPVNKAM